MANYSKAAILLSVAALLLSLALLQVVESRVLPTKDGKVAPILICTDVYGAVAGDTCFSIAKTFNLTTDAFNVINPNLNCDKIFVSEWICVDGLEF